MFLARPPGSTILLSQDIQQVLYAGTSSSLAGWAQHLSGLLGGDESVLHGEAHIKEQVSGGSPDTAQVIGSGSRVRTGCLPLHGEKPMVFVPGTHQTPSSSGENRTLLFLKFQFGGSLS